MHYYYFYLFMHLDVYYVFILKHESTNLLSMC